MTLNIPFDNTYVTLPQTLFAPLSPTPVRAPRLLAFNHHLADELGLTGHDDDLELAQVFAGNQLPKGAAPLAQLYAGHQFGHWNPQLGDGRAILLGEVSTPSGRFDIQLKGSGRTPYSRNGDGRAWLGPVLREYVVSEAMHALGAPTTRALAAVATGEDVLRDGPLPGGVITRVASSHIRVGTFQVLAARQDQVGLQALFEHAVDRHYPDATTPLDFLNAVIARQAELVAQWMSVGFIHGVMNTDNCAISGETIDYGPCAFLDDYHPETVFSSIDRHGRYGFANQADVIVWNMAQLATALAPLVPDTDQAIQEFTQAVHAMPNKIRKAWNARFCAKIGISQERDGDHALITRLLSIMADQGADFTNTFLALAQEETPPDLTDSPSYQDWTRDWRARLAAASDPQALMQAVNPAIIPRNHQVEAMIKAAVAGDMAPFERLHAALATPFEVTDANLGLTQPPAPHERVHQTFCGT